MSVGLCVHAPVGASHFRMGLCAHALVGASHFCMEMCAHAPVGGVTLLHSCGDHRRPRMLLLGS